MRVQDEIVFHFLDEGVAAPARLLREQAPETSRVVWDVLPAAGLACHGIYSGSEVYLVLSALLTPPREHATTIVGPGDVGFLTVERARGTASRRATRRSAGSTTSTRPPRCPRGRSP